MDHVRYGTTSRWYEYPGKFPDDELINTFADEIPEMAQAKIKEILERQDELVEWRTEALKYLQSKNLDEFGMYFNSMIVEIDFLEYDVLQKWLKYWLRLAKKTSNNKVWEQLTADAQKQGFTEEQMEEARAHPIEDLYEGKLRKNGSRFLGLCPFHNEKTPSFNIFEHDNSFYCFGCNAWGNAIDFYMKLHEVDFVEAMKALM